jgi:simple sugar transport system substrate-binding protein
MSQVVSWGLSHGVTVVEKPRLVHVTADQRRTFALDELGNVYVWGNPDVGHYGFPSASTLRTPILFDTDVIRIDAGRGHVALIKRSQKVFTHGESSKGRLGYEKKDSKTPSKVAGVVGLAQEVSCGGSHTAVVTQTGKLWVWGSSHFGQLGLGYMHKKDEFTSVPQVLEFQSSIKAISCGREHTLALTVEGDVLSWGFGGFGALGHSDNITLSVPRQIRSLSHIAHVSAGAVHSAAVTTDGLLYCWGSNKNGVLGIRDRELANSPVLHESLKNIRKVKCGYFHTIAISHFGQTYSWGSSVNGKLGQEGENRVEIPTIVESLRGKAAIDVACGLLHTSVLIDTRKLLDHLEKSHKIIEMLRWAIEQGESSLNLAKDTLNFFLSRPQNDLSSTDPNGRTLLHSASFFGNKTFIELLLNLRNSDSSLNLNIQDKDGNTALHLALARGHVEIARLIVDAGVDMDLLNHRNEDALALINDKQIRFELKQRSGRKDVFLSYAVAPNSSEFSRALFRKMEENHFSVWFDEVQLKAGVEWKNEFIDAVRKCNVFVFVVSSKSVASVHCQSELATAIEAGKEIFPVIFEHASLDAPPFNTLKQRQWVDFTSGSFDSNFAKLVAGIKTKLVGSAASQSIPLSNSSEYVPKPKPVASKFAKSNRSNTKVVVEPKEISHVVRNQLPKVSFIHLLGRNEFFDRLLIGVETTAKRLILDLKVAGANFSAERMAKLIGEEVDRGAESLILNHGVTEIIEPAVEIALDRGVKVVALDVTLNNPDVTEFDQDDFLMSSLLCRQLIQDTDGNANILYVNPGGHAPLVKRDRILQDYLWRYPGLNILATYGAVNDRVIETAHQDTLRMIRKFPEANTIICMWDLFARGAMLAIEELGLSDQIAVYSVDISTEDIHEMTKPHSPWVCTVASDPKLVGSLLVEATVAVWRGHQLGKYVLVEPASVSRQFLIDNNVHSVDELVQLLPEMKDSVLKKKYSFIAASEEAVRAARKNICPTCGQPCESAQQPQTHKRTANAPARHQAKRVQQDNQRKSGLTFDLGIPFF